MNLRMQYQNITIEQKLPVLLLTLNRPAALNALSSGLMQELHAFFSRDHKQWTSYTAVVITGAGEKAFVAGADISEFKGMDSSSGAEFARFGHETFSLIERFSKPVIAAVNGFALGGGCELAMACHLRYASENARFGQPEVNLGLIPGFGGTQRLIQYIGKNRAMELMLTGDIIDAKEALSLGLVGAVLPFENLIPHCLEIAAKIASKGPLAVGMVIDSVNAYYTEGVDGFSAEVRNFGRLTSTADFREGTDAFLAKRKAAFTGT